MTIINEKWSETSNILGPASFRVIFSLAIWNKVKMIGKQKRISLALVKYNTHLSIH